MERGVLSQSTWFTKSGQAGWGRAGEPRQRLATRRGRRGGETWWCPRAHIEVFPPPTSLSGLERISAAAKRPVVFPDGLNRQ